jgi:hypothetical protein
MDCESHGTTSEFHDRKNMLKFGQTDGTVTRIFITRTKTGISDIYDFLHVSLLHGFRNYP